MMNLPLNNTAIIVAALSAFVIGFLWHGPLFGKLWMKLAGIKEPSKEEMEAARKTMWKPMLANLLINIMIAYTLSLFYYLVSHSPFIYIGGIVGGIQCAIILWLGIIIPITLVEVIWMGRTCKYWAFEAVCSLVYMSAMGAIIAGWGM